MRPPDPNVLKTILASDVSNCEKGELFHEHTDSLFRTGVYDVHGELWKYETC
ncbi:hypothetical protein BD413DRAFT_612869 [Trametes elegans]|nr:hypothetical protein BD413DRAFT_612869 [Trametes elegans]